MQPEWEIWLDTHISPAIAKWLNEYTGFTAKSSYVLDLYSMDDVDVYKKAKEYGNVILMSKDVDFSELISRLGSPPKLISLKIGNCDNQLLWNFLKPVIYEVVAILTTTDADIVELE